jgi:hypothetical protein
MIMATLPPARAGVGSAVNDTVREFGGALGVAVIGSVAATAYATSMRGELNQFANLADADRRMLVDNVGAALDTSRHLGDQADQIAAVARTAFVDSMHSSLWIAAGLAFCAAVVAFTQLPHRTGPDVHAGGEYEGVAAQCGAVGERHRQVPIAADGVADRGSHDAHPVRLEFGESICAEAIGCRRVACGEAVELVDGCVAVGLVIDHRDPIPGPGQDESRRESGSPTTDDQHVAADISGCHDADTSDGAETSAIATCVWWPAWWRP